MSSELNKFVRDLAEIRAMENVAKNAKLNQEILKGQEKQLRIEQERLEIERKKISVLEIEVKEREAVERKREGTKEKIKITRKEGVALEEIIQTLSNSIRNPTSLSEELEFRIFILSNLCRKSYISFEQASAVFEDLEDLRFSSHIKSRFYELSDLLSQRLNGARETLISDQLAQVDQFCKAYLSLVPFKITLEVEGSGLTTDELNELSKRTSDLALLVEKGPMSFKEMAEFSAKVYSNLTQQELFFYETIAGSSNAVFKSLAIDLGQNPPLDLDLYITKLKTLIENERSKTITPLLEALAKLSDPSISLADAEREIIAIRKIKRKDLLHQRDKAISAFEKRKQLFLFKFTLKSDSLKEVESQFFELNSQIYKYIDSSEIRAELIEQRAHLCRKIDEIKREKRTMAVIGVALCIPLIYWILA
jgi:hypothetical protein